MTERRAAAFPKPGPRDQQSSASVSHPCLESWRRRGVDHGKGSRRDASGGLFTKHS